METRHFFNSIPYYGDYGKVKVEKEEQVEKEDPYYFAETFVFLKIFRKLMRINYIYRLEHLLSLIHSSVVVLNLSLDILVVQYYLFMTNYFFGNKKNSLNTILLGMNKLQPMPQMVLVGRVAKLEFVLQHRGRVQQI